MPANLPADPSLEHLLAAVATVAREADEAIRQYRAAEAALRKTMMSSGELQPEAECNPARNETPLPDPTKQVSQCIATRGKALRDANVVQSGMVQEWGDSGNSDGEGRGVWPNSTGVFGQTPRA
jgi:hypothetical protein